METAVQPVNGNDAATAPAKSAVQRRIDKLTREKYELQADLRRALEIIERYRTALKAARSNHA